ncbi:rhodanese-like domain-containing protein [Priestia flexa]|uniref:rhodanese-like domain-containing protein n=1 Tax=Priestia flexa TaxID=86664 RepID=UPI001B340E74|nr:rhodanese-like domain-containing protein [Priestia flexa]
MNVQTIVCDVCGNEKQCIPYEAETGDVICENCLQICYVVAMKDKKSNRYFSVGIKGTYEEGEILAKQLINDFGTFEDYKIEKIMMTKHFIEATTSGRTITEISPRELKKHLKDGGKSICLLDIREDFEVEKDLIPGAVHIPIQRIPARIHELDRKKEYIIICTAGYRALYICEFLQENGYKVKTLKGGMLGWKGLGFVVPLAVSTMKAASKLRGRKKDDLL